MGLLSAKRKEGRGLGAMGCKQGRSDGFSQTEGTVGWVGFLGSGWGAARRLVEGGRW